MFRKMCAVLAGICLLMLPVIIFSSCLNAKANRLIGTWKDEFDEFELAFLSDGRVIDNSPNGGFFTREDTGVPGLSDTTFTYTVGKTEDNDRSRQDCVRVKSERNNIYVYLFTLENDRLTLTTRWNRWETVFMRAGEDVVRESNGETASRAVGQSRVEADIAAAEQIILTARDVYENRETYHSNALYPGMEDETNAFKSLVSDQLSGGWPKPYAAAGEFILKTFYSETGGLDFSVFVGTEDDMIQVRPDPEGLYIQSN